MSDEEFGLTSEMIAHAQSEGIDVAEAYTVTTVIPYAEKPLEVETYTVPVQDLDGFFHSYHETGEIVADIRPTE